MGPKLFGFRKGETQYSLAAAAHWRLLRHGGRGRGQRRPPGLWRQAGVENAFLVVAAGGIFNIVLGFFLMMIVLGQQDVFATTQIASFTEGSALQAAGAQVGDTIVEVDGYSIYTDRDLSFSLALADPDAVSMVVNRDGQRVDLGTFPLHSQTLEDGTRTVSLDFYVEPEAVTFLSLVRRSATDTFSMVRMVVETLKGLFTGRFGLNDVAGPIGTAQAIGQAASAGLAQGFGQAVLNILLMIVMITVNLGIVNLLPLPALDGGRLLFLVWEGVTRHPVPPSTRAMSMRLASSCSSG